MASLVVKVRVAFGLGFEVRKDLINPGKFTYSELSVSGKPMFANIRLLGFSWAVRTGFAEQLVVVGGNESWYKGEVPTVNRAEAICTMLEDMDVDPKKISSAISCPDSGGDIAAIQAKMEALEVEPADCAIIGGYHSLPRISLELLRAGLHMVPVYPAEVFWLLQVHSKPVLVEYLLGGGLAASVADEIEMIAGSLCGNRRFQPVLVNG